MRSWSRRSAKGFAQPFEKNLKEYYLREQIKVIQSELGEDEGSQEEQDLYKELLETTPIPEDARQRVAKDIAGWPECRPGIPKVLFCAIIWISCLSCLGQDRSEAMYIARARRILNRDHYGLEKVKERILEYLAVRKLQMEIGQTTSKGPILCLVGPPGGIGKTSIARSVAEALGRKYTGCLWAAFAMKLKSGDIAGPISAPCPDVSLTRFDKPDEIIR